METIQRRLTHLESILNDVRVLIFAADRDRAKFREVIEGIIQSCTLAGEVRRMMDMYLKAIRSDRQ